MKKRIFSALMALCLAFSISGAAFADVEPTPTPAPTATAEPTASPEPEAEPTAAPTQTPEAKETSAASAGPESKAEPASSTEPQDEQDQTGTDPEQEAPVQTATPETADPASYPARTVEQTVGDTGVTVKVDVPAGALPEDATLTTALVGSSVENGEDQAVADVAAELDAADVDYDGFVALDISFVGADNEEIEPLQPVSVNFTLPAALLPEEVDPATLAVQHLAEDETGAVEKVETVADTADKTDGTVTVEGAVATFSVDDTAALPADAEITAKFTVNRFSIFTIIYEGIFDDYTIDAICVDERGERIDGNVNIGSGEINGGQDLNASFAPKIDGYTFEEARVVQQFTGGLFGGYYNSVRATQLNHTILGWSFISPDGGLFGNWSPIINFGPFSNRLYFVYSKNEETDPGESVVPETVSPLYSKTAIKNDDGTYDLSLSVTGAVSSKEKKLPLDIVFVIDESASMRDPFTGYTNRMAAVKDSVNQLTQKMTQRADDISVRYSVVKFSGLNETSTVLDWTTATANADAAKQVENALSQINPPQSAGTNYQAGLGQAINMLESARKGATTCVIFMTDGAPTYRTWDGEELGSGNSDTDGLNIQGAIEEVKYLNANLFYCVGVGDDFAEGADDSTASDNLNRLCEAANAGTSAWFSAVDTASLTDAFNDMVASVTTIRVKDVKISDTLSTNVSTVNNATPQVVVENGDGEDVTESEPISSIPDETKIYASLQDNQLMLNFPDDYVLKENYTYKVTLKIEPSETAKTEYKDNGYDYPKVNGQYRDIADPATGTHAGNEGFYSNVADSAILTYTCQNTINDQQIDSEEQTRKYPMPVVQVNETSLTINKTINGPEGMDKDAAAALITFTVKDEDTPVAEKVELKKQTDGTYKAVVDGLTVGKQYTVVESCTAPSGYRVEPTEASQKTNALVNNPASNAVSFTNNYTPASQLLTITKTVGGEMGSYTDDFTFDLVLSREGEADSPNYYTTALPIADGTDAKNENGIVYSGSLDDAESDHTYTFVLSNNEKMVLTVPYGYTAEVTEHSSNTGYKVSSRYYLSTITDETVKGQFDVNEHQQRVQTDNNYTIEFKNEREAVAPTGLESNHTAPYALMVTAAGVAGLALLGSMAARRRRRQE